MDSSVPEKFGSMVRAVLESLSLILNLASVEDLGKVATCVIMCLLSLADTSFVLLYSM